ncbi:PaREP1 family protein [Pyrobaculum ferrireducens]|uniref:PaREP1-like protein n=1 Tax=Pyrobaculum ferrireducens TaxID=1104324 RepID=G7VC57_9CREN|nr:PaREP1-like protein [Pyrobaculum ferrireducens]
MSNSAGAERLDPPQRVEAYLALREKYLREAEELYARGDLAQAGEKYWGAVAALLNAIAEKRGWEHYSHKDYNAVVGRLYKESGDKELLTAFGMAERLHANLRHNFMDKEIFEAHREEALKLVD